MLYLACLIGFFLAYTNGGNDNFKGVATLYGSGVTDYKHALWWSTFTTFLGSLMALLLSHGLVASFSGKGLVPDAVVAMKSFSLAVGLAAALTVTLATRFGFPISTTHALSGGLVGAGLIASETGVDLSRLAMNFFFPLLISPLIASVLAVLVYLFFKMIREQLNIKKETCICVGSEVISIVPVGVSTVSALTSYQEQIKTTLSMDLKPMCVERYQDQLFGVNVGSLVNMGHFITAGSVCFARALNDTPKLAAIFLIGEALAPSWGITVAAVGMALGGLIHSRKIAETMSHKVTSMSGGQGFCANLVTSLIVIVASKFSLPVSTTHVSCGTLFGIGLSTRQANAQIIKNILLSWVITLPVAGLLSAGIFFLLN